MRTLTTTCLLLLTLLLNAQQHPLTFFTRSEAALVKRDLTRYPLLKNSYQEMKKEVDAYLGKDVDVPFPKDPAGGYTHDQHKFNYMLMFNSGVLYNLTGDKRYATLVKELFFKYAKLNPTLGNHPEATSSSPGHIFWQALNDANWLVYCGMAYDLIYPSLTTAEKKTIEQGAFKPEVDFMTKDLQTWFDLIHNHGVWACAGVGIVGIATNNKEYVDMALYGTKKDGKSGFIAQLNGLFSPDGYYTEGPYYVRYAILPYYLFANALQNARPALNIFQHRDAILQKALLAALQQTNLDGTFFPLNDALKEKDYTSNEIVTAINIAWNVYGKDSGLLAVARKQNRVLPNKGGASIAAALATTKSIPAYFPYKSIEFKDGVKGDEGGVSLLRLGNDDDLTTLIYKYTSHGLSHGHYDKLNYNLYDQGNEIITDYGSVRFIGVEQKYGGRYLPENKTFASQSIAHNTIVADEKSHFDGKEAIAEKFHSDKLFSSIQGKAVKTVVAREQNAYPGIDLQRSVYLLQLPSGKKLLVDLFSAQSDEKHQYDLPFQYNGQVISTSFSYQPYTSSRTTLGKKNGYQFYWKEADATVQDTIVQLTFLNGRTYYTISSLVEDKAEVMMARTGANDPKFNLRQDPALIIRKDAKNAHFLNVVEIHGNWNPVIEFSTSSYSSVKDMNMILHNKKYSIARMLVDNKPLIIMQANEQFDLQQQHSVQGMSWKGPFAVQYDGTLIN